MTAHKFTVGSEAQRRAVVRLRDEREQRGRDLNARLVAAYLSEEDREYADEFYGSMLAERGVDVRTLAGAR